jgi:methylthioxylose transferase
MTVRSAPPGTDRGARPDIHAALVAAAAFVGAAVVGALSGLAGHPVHAGAAPLFGHWLPHVGPGTPLAVAVAAAVACCGPAAATRLRWRSLLAGSYAAMVLWILSLALVDGWRRGLATRLTTPFEYVSEVGGVGDVPSMLRGFTGRILDGGPDPWTTHVAGHPPGALLVFVSLDRIGLDGGGWAAVVCALIGAVPAIAVPVTVRAVGGEPAARAAVPFLVLFPGAVWIGASADGLFAGVAAAGLALLAIGLTRPSPVAAVGAGVLLAASAYLSYGLVLVAPLVIAVAVLAGTFRPLAWTALGAAAVVVAFSAGGFWWLDGYEQVKVRYAQGLASHRPYAYWVWANLAAVAACAGPAAAPILRRAVRTARWSAPIVLPLAAAAAIGIADVSGLSKAEVERIWLPFAVWLPAGAALLPDRGRRAWLAAQAGTALLVNHLLLTAW